MSKLGKPFPKKSDENKTENQYKKAAYVQKKPQARS